MKVTNFRIVLNCVAFRASGTDARVCRAVRHIEKDDDMPVTHNDMMARIPKARQARVKTRAAELQRGVGGLKAQSLIVEGELTGR